MLNTEFKLFGNPFTPDFVLKLLALVFALGMLVQRLDNLEAAVKVRFDAEANTSSMRFSELSQRLTRVENKLDQQKP